ncbi:unnamed protein product [Dovyalis caffra]|uniref:Uncharacterized protein n=1 Tax=Dovyalis caffra TaxID=77055 RepID=A0AAV1R7V7_9ROSI|nr:unnamed protein product [Dovyalis caffra]
MAKTHLHSRIKCFKLCCEFVKVAVLAAVTEKLKSGGIDGVYARGEQKIRGFGSYCFPSNSKDFGKIWCLP